MGAASLVLLAPCLNEIAIKMSAAVAVMRRFRISWGWRISFPDSSLTWQEAPAPHHMGLSIGLLEGPHNKAAGFLQSE